MPPRFAYWTIILEGKPTAFRAHQRDELLPTFKQLQTKHPDVVLKWFARGRLWESPEEAQAAQRGGRDRRTPAWRPGGEHRDPRARFKVPRDEKRRRFAAKVRRDARDRSAPSTGESAQDKAQTKPAGDRLPDRHEWRGGDRRRDNRPKTRSRSEPVDNRDARWKKPGPDGERDRPSRPFDRGSSRDSAGARRAGGDRGSFDKKPGRSPHRGPGGRKPGGGRRGGGGGGPTQ